MTNNLVSTALPIDEHKHKLELIQLFSGISSNVIDKLSSLMKEVTVKKNTLVITQGDTSRSLFIISTGRLKVFANDEYGNQTIFTFLSEGDFFGELSLLDSAPRSASVMAVDDCKLLTLSHQNFTNILEEHSEISQPLFTALTMRIRQMDETICDLTSRDTYGRLAQTLYREVKKQEDDSLVTKRLTHQDLAEMIGSSREMVSRILKDLRIGEYISIDQKQITILRKLPRHW